MARQLLHEFRPLFQLLREPVGPRSFFGVDPFHARRIDVTEEDDKFIIETEVPGLKKGNLDISIGNGGRNITIQGKSVDRRNDSTKPQEVSSEPSEGISRVW